MLRASDLIAGRYRLESRVPASSTGEVWEAVDLVQGRPVAVRFLAAQDNDDNPALERFRAVARLAASLSHPSVTQVVDYGEGAAGEPAYVVTELVEAPSLAGLLAVGPLEPARTMNLLEQAASGLQAAHGAGLVHGDISPANLLVGADDQVKISDFVTACCLNDAPVSSSPYLPPERADAGPATPAGDLYSLGVVGYECLIGTRRFSRATAKLAAHPGHSLAPLPRSVPAAVAGLVDDLTARDPAKRPASAERVSVRARLLHDSQTKGHNDEPKGRDAQAKRRSNPASGRDTKGAKPAGRRGEHRHDEPTPVPTLQELPTSGSALVEGRTAILSLPDHALPPHAAPARRRSRWPLLVGGAGAILAAVLIGWLLANAFATPTAPSNPAAPAHTPSAGASAPAAGTVEVNDAALAGQRVSVVTQRLRQLGLRPRVVWANDTLQPPGTVITIGPSGRVPVGSVVTITGAKRPPGHHPSATR
jgi:serine/threonine-protein kinase